MGSDAISRRTEVLKEALALGAVLLGIGRLVEEFADPGGPVWSATRYAIAGLFAAALAALLVSWLVDRWPKRAGG